jgi:hypothetical protein
LIHAAHHYITWLRSKTYSCLRKKREEKDRNDGARQWTGILVRYMRLTTTTRLSKTYSCLRKKKEKDRNDGARQWTGICLVVVGLGALLLVWVPPQR